MVNLDRKKIKSHFRFKNELTTVFKNIDLINFALFKRKYTLYISNIHREIFG